MAQQLLLDHGLEPVDRLFRGEAQIEASLEFAGDHVGSTRARGNVRYLKGGRLKVLVAAIPAARRELGQRGHYGMHGVIGELRVGDVSLNAMYGEAPAQRAAPADLDGVAKCEFARRLADQAPIDGLAALAQHLDHSARAVDRWPFFIAGDQE